MALRWTDVNAEATTKQIADSLPLPAPLRALVKPMLRRQIRGQALGQGLVRLPLDTILAELHLRMEELEVLLEDSPFFFSERPGAADLAIFGQLSTLRSGPTPQGAALLEKHPVLCEHSRRVDEATRRAGVPRGGRKAA
jgi:glutathione S-transferase